ncbi:S66 family peptidase [Staphylococcus delphini]|uniref:S66 family peptidase n=1 Tax=Staphylococcus delphini TaxID=53344 RepID=UPI0021CE1928|nr:S66 peptidase family protein [Staphylococcus delphini]UXS44411.1 LD-carboxypeptidase [Staphylococcus delphini]UXV45037.1 LD-carboxypeptidase [Staphylococcus delphini]
MTFLQKPPALKPGNTVALVSPSSGLAGESDIAHRVTTAIQRLEQDFQLKVKVMPHALKGLDYVQKHPQKRAEDLNNAFADPTVKAIITFIGGNDSIRVTEHLKPDIIQNNPKIFMGYSDATSLHLFLYQHGIASFYGPAILTDFAENVSMDDYTTHWIRRTLFDNAPLGNIPTSPYYHRFGLLWHERTHHTPRPTIDNHDYEVINGHGTATGELLGGCIEVLNRLRNSTVFPDTDTFKDKILFLENSEAPLSVPLLAAFIEFLGTSKILKNVNGIIIGKPQNGEHYEAYKRTWQAMLEDFDLHDLPVFYNASFGHNEPKCIIPYGATASLDVDNKTFTIHDNACE